MRYMHLFVSLAFVATTATAGPFSWNTAPGDEAERKINSVILQNLRTYERMARTAGVAHAKTAARPRPGSLLRTNGRGDYHVYVALKRHTPGTEQQLRRIGLVIERSADDVNLVEGWIAADRIRALARHDGVRSVRPVGRRIVRAGGVTSEGDAILGSDLVRNLGWDGTGVKLGLISDDVDHLADAQAAGDLPTTNLTIVNTTESEGDEGTAMLEIVHDLAPGAELYFASTGESSLEMRDMIRELARLGCRVIVDDIGWTDQPFFEDGFIAQVADSVVEAGIVYVSAGGNDALQHYQGAFKPVPMGAEGDAHAWDGASQVAFPILLADQENVSVLLQWNDEFGASGNDYDAALFSDETLQNALAAGSDTQDGDDDPWEALEYENTTGSEQTVYLAVGRGEGVEERIIGVYVSGGGTYEFPEAHRPGAIYGHPAAKNVIAVAAIDADEPPHTSISDYSSHGPVTIFFPTEQVRQKPDVTGIAGVAVTGAGGFDNPFYGTSAAAPHVAAVVAQLLHAQPGWTPDDVRSALETTALDLGDPGRDNVYGSGRVRAQEATAYAPTSVGARGPERLTVATNYPNPFNPSTTIEFALVADGEASLTIYNVLGQPVRTLLETWQPAGTHYVRWDSADSHGRAMASGVYFVRLQTPTDVLTRRMALVR